MSDFDTAVTSALETDLTIDITTTGTGTGLPRRIEIWFLNLDGRIYITGTPGPRDWVANLRADPSFVFHLKESTIADLPATARFVDDAPTRQAVFEHEAARWYRNQTSLAELVATAPLIEVTFDA